MNKRAIAGSAIGITLLIGAGAGVAVAQAPPVYANCAEVLTQSGRGNITPADPGFQPKFDRDGDGVGCEEIGTDPFVNAGEMPTPTPTPTSAPVETSSSTVTPLPDSMFDDGGQINEDNEGDYSGGAKNAE